MPQTNRRAFIDGNGGMAFTHDTARSRRLRGMVATAANRVAYANRKPGRGTT